MYGISLYACGKGSVGGVENAENIAINRYGERFCCLVEYIVAFEEIFA